MTKSEIIIYENEAEQMTRKFMNRHIDPNIFKRFADIYLIGYSHSEKWSIVYDWMHQNFKFEVGEEDGKIITKFVELVEENRL